MGIDKKNKNVFFSTWYYILIILIFGFLTLKHNNIIGMVEIISAMVLWLISYFVKSRKQIKILKMLEHDIMTADVHSKNALMHFPLPTAITNLDGKVIWSNDSFSEIFGGGDMYGENISKLFTGFSYDDFVKSNELGMMAEVTAKDRHFKMAVSVSLSEKSKMFVSYFYEITDYAELKKKYSDEMNFLCRVYIDNYDEMLSSAPQNSKPKIQAQLDEIINEWIGKSNGVSVKYEKDKYLVFFENKYLEGFIKDKFDVLNKVRAISEGNTLPVTISIGVGVRGENLGENDNFSKDAINMALGRGGDQAVIKDNDQFRFYGGTTKEHEKSTRVKARVVSFALNGLIANAQDVLIMGHRNADMDSVGSAFGLYRLCKNQGKNVNIIMENYDQTVKNMLSKLENVEEYSGIFISNVQAMSKANSQTLLIVVDTHKPSICECPKLLEAIPQIVVIDHHRRGTEFIQNASLIYHEPYASSTSEMVTEILQYAPEKTVLTKLEAECLYAGICVDTKNFTFKTGVRTFEAASYLRKHGVDTVSIKKVFQQDLPNYIIKADIIKNARIIRDNIAISVCSEILSGAQNVIAQSADELLNIKGITASFVLSLNDDKTVSISGRSLGEINVQVILEKLGGGGHLTVAGAQLEDSTINDAEVKLEAAIEEYYIDAAN